MTRTDTHPDMLEVEGQVSDKRFNQSLLHPEVLFCLFKYFIFQLFKRSAFRDLDFLSISLIGKNILETSFTKTM